MSIEDIGQKLEKVIDSRKSAVGERKSATIASGETVSEEIDLGGNFACILIEIPTIDSANISLQTSLEPRGNFQDLSSVVYAAGTGAKSNTFKLGGWRYIKIKASAAQTSGAVTFIVRGVTF